MADQDILHRLSLLKMAICLCQDSKHSGDRELKRMAESWCVKHFGLICDDVVDMDWRDVGKIIEWLKDTKTN